MSEELREKLKEVKEKLEEEFNSLPPHNIDGILQLIYQWHIRERKKWAKKLFPKQVKAKIEGEDIFEYGNKVFNQCREEFFRRIEEG